MALPASDTFARAYADGVLCVLPVIVAAVPIGALFGALAIQQGLTPAEAVLMSGIVFAGASQFVALDLWADPAPWLALGFAALTVNLRHVMMSASLARAMPHFSAPHLYGTLFFLTDETWALAERRARSAGLSHGFMWGMGTSLYVSWLAATAFGASLGALLQDPARYGLDFAFNALFIALIVGFWQGRSTLAVIAVAAAVAIATKTLLGGTWYIIAGGAAGMATAVAVHGVAAGNGAVAGGREREHKGRSHAQ